MTRARAGALLLLAAWVLFLGGLLGLAASRTGFLEQDGAYYCEVTERSLCGQGFTTLSDRRGPADPLALPHDFSAANRWPWVLHALGRVTGEVRVTAIVVSLLALLATLVLGARLITRQLATPAWLAISCMGLALCGSWTLRAAILPETDMPGFCLGVAVLVVLTERRWLALALLLPLALLARFQNVALLFPLVWVLTAAWPRLRALLLGAGVAAGLWIAGPRAFEGIGEAFWPWHPDSLPRELRYLFPPAIVGLALTRLRGPIVPLLWFGAGHFLVLLANHDPHSQHEWLFGNRHGIPLQLVAAAGAAVAAARTPGRWRWPILFLLVAAAVDNLRRPWKLANEWAARTAAPGLAQMVGDLRAHPLPEGSLVLCHDSDVLALYLRQPAAHSRGFAALPPERLVAHLRERGITHVLLTWIDKPVLRVHNEWLDRLAAALEPVMQPVRVHATADERARAVLFSWR